MTKTTRTALVLVTTFLLAALVGLAIFLPRLNAQEPVATPKPETHSPSLTPDDDRFIVLNEEDETVFPTSRKSEPNKSFNVGYGTPPGFPAGVPVQNDAWVQWQFYEYEDGELSYMFVGGEEEFQAALDQFAFTGWRLDKDETLGAGTRIVQFSNEVNIAKVVRSAPVEGQDEWYGIRVKPN